MFFVRDLTITLKKSSVNTIFWQVPRKRGGNSSQLAYSTAVQKSQCWDSVADYSSFEYNSFWVFRRTITLQILILFVILFELSKYGKRCIFIYLQVMEIFHLGHIKKDLTRSKRFFLHTLEQVYLHSIK